MQGTESAYEPTGDVAVLTLSNPPANLFTLEVGEDIRSGVERARGEGARAMVIQADGAVFSGGADVSLFKDRSLEEARDLMIGFMPILAALEDAPFPVIAAVHELCFAAGLELALACDLIIAAEGTQFAQVEALIGATTFGGGVYRLAERCGPARAREIAFGADTYSAEQFERWNIINRVVPAEQLRDRALKWARRLAKGPTAAHAATKRLLRHALANGTRSADGYMGELARHSSSATTCRMPSIICSRTASRSSARTTTRSSSPVSEAAVTVERRGQALLIGLNRYPPCMENGSAASLRWSKS